MSNSDLSTLLVKRVQGTIPKLPYPTDLNAIFQAVKIWIDKDPDNRGMDIMLHGSAGACVVIRDRLGKRIQLVDSVDLEKLPLARIITEALVEIADESN